MLISLFLTFYFRAEQELKKSTGEKVAQPSRVEEEYLKPTYEASIASDFEDGLFDGMYHN